MSVNTVKEIEKLWLSFLPGQAFEYSFIDEHFDTLYKSEIRPAGYLVSFQFWPFLSPVWVCLALAPLLQPKGQRK